MNKHFVLKKEHLKLLQNMWIDFDEFNYYGAPHVNEKRPYGNSDVYMDVAEIVGIPFDDDYGDKYLSEDNHKDAQRWHAETGSAVWIVLQNAGNTVPLGIWEQEDYFKWVYIGPEKEVA